MCLPEQESTCIRTWFWGCKNKGSEILNWLWEVYLESTLLVYRNFPDGSAGKEFACNTGDLASIPGLGRSPGEKNGNPLQHSCLQNSMDRGVWWAIYSMGLQRVGHDWLVGYSIYILARPGRAIMKVPRKNETDEPYFILWNRNSRTVMTDCRRRD